MVFQRVHYHYPKVREVNILIYVLSMITFAENLISIFVPIFLLTNGYSVAQIIGFHLLAAIYFVVIGLLFKDLLLKASDKLLLTISLPFIILFYFLLPQILNYPVLYFLLPMLTSIFGILFNVGYHADFSASCKDDHSGSDVGRQHALRALTTIASPVMGGFLISVAGYSSTFYVASLLLLAAIFPLWLYPKHIMNKEDGKIRPMSYIKDKKLRPMNISSFGYAIESSVALIIWPLFLYSIFGKALSIGALASLALLFSALVSFYLGKFIDTHEANKVLRFGDSPYPQTGFFVRLSRRFQL